MPTVPSHAVAALAMLSNITRRPVPASLLLAGAACAMLPDVDVIGFSFGIRYGDLIGHRGLTHSLVFAAALAASIALIDFWPDVGRGRVWTYLFVCAASHGILDAATSGGLGVAFFSPFSNTRYFWPWRPIRVSPIGIREALSRQAAKAFVSELLWVWTPSALLGLLAFRLRTQQVRR